MNKMPNSIAGKTGYGKLVITYAMYGMTKTP